MVGFMFNDPSAWGVEDDNSCRAACEAEVAKFGRLIETHEERLEKLSERGSLVSKPQSASAPVWDTLAHPVSFGFAVDDVTNIVDDFGVENADRIRKAVLVFATLCGEMKSLIAEAENNFYDPISLYGEGVMDEDLEEGDAELMMGNFVPLFPELDAFVRRCAEVLTNSMEQLAAVYRSGTSTVDMANVHLVHVLQCIGGVFSTLQTLDEIIKRQPLLMRHWTLYKRLLVNVRRQNDASHGDEVRMSSFFDVLRNVEDSLLSDKIFLNCLSACEDVAVGNKKDRSRPGSSEEWVEWKECLRLWANQLEFQVGQTYELDRRLGQQLMALTCCFILYSRVSQGLDKKLAKQIWEFHKKIPVVVLHGSMIWLVDEFMLQHLSSMASVIDKKAMQGAINSRSTLLQQKTASIGRDGLAYAIQVCAWASKPQDMACTDMSKLKMDDIKRLCHVLIQGLLFAHRLSFTVKMIMNLHVRLEKPMSKADLTSLCRLIELLQSVRSTFHRHACVLAEGTGYVLQHLSYVALTTIRTAKKRVLKEKHSNRRSDILAALVLAESALNGPPTKSKRLVTLISMAFARCPKTLTEEELSTLEKTLKKMEFICELGPSIEAACDGSFLFWHRIIIPIYFDDVLQSGTDPHRVHDFFSAMEDCLSPLSSCRHVIRDKTPGEVFCKEVMDAFERQFLLPLCTRVETDLRLETHGHLQLEDRNPFKSNVPDLSHFVSLRPVQLGKMSCSVKKYVEEYLERTFYTLTTIALHDWKTYGEMRRLARTKYGLETEEPHLPSQTLEQGLDVLEIMRNLPIFVAKYVYNLNTQTFSQVSSNNKHLETIGIKHVANSIRTHGPGIMNTTVNITYQFLRKKFQIFSQFLYDDHIKARLMKDVRFFKENKEVLGQRYPYDRAEEFNRGIRRLGLTPDGQTYLDKFRVLITQIGNAMGYVRMIRSGGLHCCGKAARFIPDLDTFTMTSSSSSSNDNSSTMPIAGFKEMADHAEMSPETLAAGERLDSIIAEICKKFSQGTQYFRILVDVLAPAFKDQKHAHLRNFFIIVPPLTINFVEHHISSLEKLSKRNKEGAGFTDDGFAMGVAFILKLLDQYEDFDSLHWFASAKARLSEASSATKIPSSSSSATGDTSGVAGDAPTQTLTLKRLEKYLMGMDLLRYNLSSARIFFQWGSDAVKTGGSVKGGDDGSIADDRASLKSSQQSINQTI